MLRRVAPPLRRTGIRIDHTRVGHDRARMIAITVAAAAPTHAGEMPSAPSASSAADSESNAALTDTVNDVRTAEGDADGKDDVAVRMTCTGSANADGADSADNDWGIEASLEEENTRLRWSCRL
jgi:hypothetical protein